LITNGYRSGVSSVLWAARGLEEAAASGDEIEVQASVLELQRVAEARESSGGAVEGFAAPAPATGSSAPERREETLAKVLAELDVGQALLAAGTMAGEQGLEPAPAALADALDELQESTRQLEEETEAATAGFWGAPKAPDVPPLEAFRDEVPQTIDAIVTRTVDIGKAAASGLAAIPVSTLQPVVAGSVSALSAIPDVGPIVQAGLRAVWRAVEALQGLVPSELADKVRQWASEWWDQQADPFLDRLVRRLLSVDSLRPALDAALAKPGLADERLRAGFGQLVELNARHERAAKLIRSIMRVLTKLVPLAGLIAAVAIWLYGAGGLGFLLALGTAIWLGRDHLDTGALVEVVPGLRVILAEATA
jgi:hypothetical protein